VQRVLLPRLGVAEVLENTAVKLVGAGFVHASNLLAKLHCSGRAQAVSEAIRRGIIKVE